jgi:hypothetical protein
MAACIVARICREPLFLRVADALFRAFIRTAAAWVVAEAHRLVISQPTVKLTAGSGPAPIGGGVAWTS